MITRSLRVLVAQVHTRYQVLKAVKNSMWVFWVVTPCGITAKWGQYVPFERWLRAYKTTSAITPLKSNIENKNNKLCKRSFVTAAGTGLNQTKCLDIQT
jgi:hypothetical protein